MPTSMARAIRLLASDIDGTVTTNGRLAVQVVRRFQELEDNGVSVVLITGRPAGWAGALAQYLPGVRAVLSENGAILSTSDMTSPPIQLDGFTAKEVEERRARVSWCLTAIQRIYPKIRMGVENPFRLTDTTFEVDPSIDVEKVGEVARTFNVRHTFSSVHHHLSISDLDKRTGLIRALDIIAPEIANDLKTVAVTLGDSVNDASLFDRECFAATVGVAGIRKSLSLLPNSGPEYITHGDASDGFLELSALLLESRALNV